MCSGSLQMLPFGHVGNLSAAANKARINLPPSCTPEDSMGQRKNSRTKMVLPLRVWGTDANGNPFVQLAHTLDVSAHGARLAGFRAALSAGDIVGVQYRLQKSQFRVAWVGRPGSAKSDQIGIEYLEPDKKIFGLELSGELIADDYQAPETEDQQLQRHEKQRQHLRYPVAAGVEVRTPSHPRGNWGRLLDVSLGGCYLQIATPLPLHMRCSLLLRVGDLEIEMNATVRTSHPSVGMGLQFTSPAGNEHGERLRQLISQLESGALGQISPAARKPDSAYLTERLQSVSNELMAIEALMKSIGPDPLVLRQFRDTLGAVRTSSWAVQKWLELEDRKEDMFPVLTHLNEERIRVATQLCKSLAKDMRGADLKLEKKQLEELLRAVEDLFSHLAGFSLLEVEPLETDDMKEAAEAELARPGTRKKDPRRAKAHHN